MSVPGSSPRPGSFVSFTPRSGPMRESASTSQPSAALKKGVHIYLLRGLGGDEDGPLPNLTVLEGEA